MKKLLLLIITLVLILGSGCTVDSPGYMKVVDSNGNIITIDEDTGTLVTIDYNHIAVHNGEAFLSFTANESLSDAEIITLAFKTMPAGERAHMFIQYSTLVGGSVTVWEGATWTTGTGELNPIINRNREAGLAFSGILEDKTATPAFTATNNILEKVAGLNTAGATKIYTVYAWGKKEKLLPGNVFDTAGFTLKPATQYAVVFTAIGNGNKAQILLEWLEQSD